MKKCFVYLFSTVFLIIALSALSCEFGNAFETKYAEEYSFRDDIQLIPEMEYYAEGTPRILVYWTNNSQYDAMYGESWNLERYDEKKDKWVILPRIDGENAVIMIGYSFFPNSRNKKIYYLDAYIKNIKKGKYRIISDYHITISPGVNEFYEVAAEFTVTDDSSLVGISELDYADLENSYEFPLYGDYPVHVYKNKQSLETTVVINGTDEYKIDAGFVKSGVTHCGMDIFGGKWHLIYTYSCYENGYQCSHVGVFDLDSRKEIFLSDAYADCDLVLNYRSDDYPTDKSENLHYYLISTCEYGDEPLSNYGYASKILDSVGSLRYKNGEFYID